MGYNKDKIREREEKKMRIEYNEYDKGYPYTIYGGWGDKVYCNLDGLKALKKEINKILREEKLKKEGWQNLNPLL